MPFEANENAYTLIYKNGSYREIISEQQKNGAAAVFEELEHTHMGKRKHAPLHIQRLINFLLWDKNNEACVFLFESARMVTRNEKKTAATTTVTVICPSTIRFENSQSIHHNPHVKKQ